MTKFDRHHTYVCTERLLPIRSETIIPVGDGTNTETRNFSKGGGWEDIKIRHVSPPGGLENWTERGWVVREVYGRGVVKRVEARSRLSQDGQPIDVNGEGRGKRQEGGEKGDRRGQKWRKVKRRGRDHHSPNIARRTRARHVQRTLFAFHRFSNVFTHFPYLFHFQICNIIQ